MIHLTIDCSEGKRRVKGGVEGGMLANILHEVQMHDGVSDQRLALLTDDFCLNASVVTAAVENKKRTCMCPLL